MGKVAERQREVEGEDFAKHWFILGRVLGSSKRDVASFSFPAEKNGEFKGMFRGFINFNVNLRQ